MAPIKLDKAPMQIGATISATPAGHPSGIEVKSNTSAREMEE